MKQNHGGKKLCFHIDVSRVDAQNEYKMDIRSSVQLSLNGTALAWTSTRLPNG